MINVDFEKEVIHTIKFDADQIKEILIQALRITGVDVPDCPDVEVDELPDFEVIMRFSQEDLDEYLKEQAELSEEPVVEAIGAHWVSDDEEVNAAGSCSGCPAAEEK